MEKVHSVVAWYQKKIGAYDKQFWEQSVEKKLQKGQSNVHHGHASKKIVRLKTEFIDVDLIRGSTFSKAKPQVPWIYITRKTVVRLVFLPLCFKWWVQQTSWKFYFLLLMIYFMQVISLCIYVKNVGIVRGIEDEVSLTEVMMPMVLMMVLGLIHSQTMLSHYSHKQLYRDGKLGRRYTKSKKQSDNSSSTGSGRRNAEQSRTHESQSQKNKANRQRNVNVTNTEDLAQEKTTPSVSGTGSVCRDKIKSESSSSVIIKNKSGDKQNGGSSNKKENGLRYNQKQSHVLTNDLLNQISKSLNEKKQTNVLDKEVLDDDDDTESENIFSYSVGNSEANLVTNSFYRLDDSISKFEVLSVDEKDLVSVQNRKDDTEEGTSGLVLPKSITGKIIPPGSAVTRHDDIIIESKPPWKSLMSYKKRLQEEANFADTERLSDECPSDNEEELGSFSGSSSSKVKKTVIEKCAKERNDLTADEVNIQELGSFVGSSFNKLKKTVTENCAKERSNSVTDKVNIQELSENSAKELSNLTAEKINNPEFESLNGSSSKTIKKEFTENCAKEQKDLTMEKVNISTSPECSKPKCNIDRDSEFKIPDKLALGNQDRPLTLSGTSLRRRRRVSASRSADLGEVAKARNVPNSLGLRQPAFRSNKQSSSENETAPTSPDKDNKVSSEEWEDRIHSDVTTSSSYSSSCASAEASDSGDGDPFREHKPAWTASSFHVINLLQPPTASNTGVAAVNPPDEVSCVVWEGNECRKVDLTAFDIGWAIIDKVDNIPESSDYVLIGIIFTVIMGCFPIIFRAYNLKDLPVIWSLEGILSAWNIIELNPWRRNFLTINAIFQRMCLSLIFFFLLSVADRTFKQRLLYAKHFCYLTSSRRARKFDMPHFRLNKVRNIKIWLSLRSYLKRRGPQRSVDIIVSATFLVAVSLVTLMCLQMLKDTDTYLDYMCNWEIVIWCMALGTYLLRFMTLGLKINKKYRSLSVLITEQINLYLQMEQKPHKKEELMLANNVLKLAEDLLKELESPFKISGFSANPFIYNVTKVVVLSAFSAVLTELLGFKLKLYKIKFKA